MQGLASVSVIARSEAMRAVLERVETVAPSESTLLLLGETGVGKELIAEYVHRKSPRADRPFVKVGLASLPPDLLESELFGHEKGAYTSASSEKKGLFELAHSGSIFLDDIDDFPLSLQPKLLRVLESRELMRVGGTKSIPIDTRVICASKVDLKELVERGGFRSDLYYRINVVPVTIPPLRARKEDVPLLLHHFLKRYAPDKEIMLTPGAMQRLEQYSWPGNVRELRNVIQRVALFANGSVDLGDLPPEIRDENTLELLLKACNRCFTEDQMSFDQVVSCLEVNLLQQALRESSGNRSEAARTLKMSLSTFRDKLKKYNLDSNGSGS